MKPVHFLGYDLGSSSVKACLFDGDTGRAVARSSYPDVEMPIAAPRPGWAEQNPESWWDAVVTATERLPVGSREVGGIGISYQMHGLVLVGEDGRRPPSVHHLVRQPRGRDWKRGLPRSWRGALPKASSQLPRELHCLEAPVGEVERARSLRADSGRSSCRAIGSRCGSPVERRRRSGSLRRNLLGLRGRARRRISFSGTTKSVRAYLPSSSPRSASRDA